MTAELIIQTQDSNGDFLCERYENLPAPKTVYLAICFTNNTASEQLATDLKNKLLAAISNLGTNFRADTPVCGGGRGSLMSCRAVRNPDNLKLLIVVSDSRASDFADNDVLTWSDTTLPVLPRGIPVSLPSPFNQPNAVFWHSDIDEVLPTIFGLMGISDEDLRIFISYRRTDTAALAEQLFDGLTHEGFEVFLDRYSINPGIHFQNRLYQELADKSMVVFLESADFLNSSWIQLEISFAVANRLGFLALNIDNAPKIPAIDEQYRINIFSPPLTADGTLPTAALNSLINDIKKRHAVALYLRKNYLNQNIEAALNYAGQNAVYDASGFINDGVKDYKILPTARPPKISDYHHAATANNSARKIIFGPKFMEDRRKLLNNWLAEKSSVEFFNEGQILDLAKSL